MAQSCFDAGKEIRNYEKLRIRSGTRESISDISLNTYSSVNSDADDEAPTDDDRQEVNETNYEPNKSSPTLKQCTSEKEKANENYEVPKTTMGKQKTSTRELIGQLDRISKEAELNVTTILQNKLMTQTSVWFDNG